MVHLNDLIVINRIKFNDLIGKWKTNQWARGNMAVLDGIDSKIRKYAGGSVVTT